MDSLFAYPPVPQTGELALMARFSTGEDHVRRRGYAVAALAEFDVARVRDTARQAAARAVKRADKQAEKQAGTVAVDVIRLARGIIAEIFAVRRHDSDPEVAANRLGLRVQATDATTGLIASALLHGCSPAEALRIDPPVINTRRIVNGQEIVIDLRDGPFGGEPRPCPGRELAMAIAEEIVGVLREGTLLPFDGVYEDWPNMRIPARLEVRFG
jgi:cytochrome P450